MRRQVMLALALLLVLPTPITAQAIDLTARGSDTFIVYVDGVEVSRHPTEREAIQRVTLALAENPAATIHYIHDYTVDATIVGGRPSAPPREPSVAPDAAPDPDPTPDPTPSSGRSALHPNEPAGMTVLYDNDGRHALGPMWDDDYYSGRSRVVDDPANPTGSGKAIRVTHPAGQGGGGAKLASWGDLGTTLGGQGVPRSGWRELYLSHRRAYESGFTPCQRHANGDRGFKFFYLGMHTSAKQGGGANEMYLTGCTNTSFTVQPGGGGRTRDWFLNPSWPPSAPLQTWHLEIRLIAESPSRGDGQAYIYANGSLVRHITGIAFSDPTRPGTLFDGMELYHTAEPAASTEAWLEREWYVSGR